MFSLNSMPQTAGMALKQSPSLIPSRVYILGTAVVIRGGGGVEFIYMIEAAVLVAIYSFFVYLILDHLDFTLFSISLIKWEGVVYNENCFPTD